MHWIIQSNMFSEENYEHLLAALARLDISHSVHKVIPFGGGIDPEPDLPQGSQVTIMGSISIGNLAKKRGWTPGAFTDNLDFETQRKAWGAEFMLNGNSLIVPCLEDVPAALEFNGMREPFFMRPTGDTKTFTGYVTDFHDVSSWIERMRVQLPDENVRTTLSESVMLSTKKEIWSETRVWIVDSKVVTASGYKRGGRVYYTTPDQVAREITDFAQARANLWNPNRAYVMDVAETPDGLKIIEVNCINSAGWYRCDMQKLVHAIDSLI